MKYGRKVAVSGRSMENVIEAAIELKYMHVPDKTLIALDEIDRYPKEQLVVITTGSQGESMAALTRMAFTSHKMINIEPDDLVIISASPIPGNERMIYRVINNLFKLGANVVYESLEKIHVSGHACQEEHKIMHSLLRPKFFIPVHGEYRHLKRHALLAEETGMRPECIFIPDIGVCAEVTDESITQGESFPAGSRLIDGEGYEDSKGEVLKDRIRMSSEGVFIVTLALSHGTVLSDVNIESRGFVFSDEQEYLRDLKDVVEKAIESVGARNREELCAAIKRAMKNYLFKKTKQSPMIIPIILDV